LVSVGRVFDVHVEAEGVGGFVAQFVLELGPASGSEDALRRYKGLGYVEYAKHTHTHTHYIYV